MLIHRSWHIQLGGGNEHGPDFQVQCPHINASEPCHELKPSVHVLEPTCANKEKRERRKGKRKGKQKFRNFEGGINVNYI
jgi:hypothetical protein